MKFKFLSSVLTVGLSTIVTLHAQESRMISSQRKTPYWQDVNVVQVNKEYPRTQFMTFDNKPEAMNSRFEESKY